MTEMLAGIWRQRKRFFLLLCSMLIGTVTVCSVAAVSGFGNILIDRELDAMGMDGLIVTSAAAAISDEAVTKLDAQSYIEKSTPLCYRYCSVTVGEQSQKVLLWGIDDRVYDTVSIELLHGRRITDADAGSLCGMVDAAFAAQNYGRENIIGKVITVPIGKIPVQMTVVGVVHTGGGMTGQLMGGTIPSFLYLPMETLQSYLGKSGYNHLMLTLNDSISAADASAKVTECFASVKNSIEVQNMTDSRTQFSGVLELFSTILYLFGFISLITTGISMMTVMLQNIREQTPQIGIKKALGASDLQIGIEYLLQSVLLSVFGTACGVLLTAIAAAVIGRLLSLDAMLPFASLLLPAIPGMLCSVLFGVYPAIKAARCIPAQAISKL